MKSWKVYKMSNNNIKNYQIKKVLKEIQTKKIKSDNSKFNLNKNYYKNNLKMMMIILMFASKYLIMKMLKK